MNPSRNDPCPCGSGKKYKHCCERKASPRPALPATGFNQLGALLNAGHFAEVETRARALLELYPDEPGVWKLLAMSLQMQGKDGLTAFQRTAELLPNDAGAHMNLGNALQDARRLDEALLSYQHALVIKPIFAEAYNNLGSAYAELGRLGEAASSYRQAVQIKPDFAAAHSDLGGVLRTLGHLDEAAASYRRAIKAQPTLGAAHNNLGITLRDLGQFEQAVASYRQALKFEPGSAEVHGNLGVALRDIGQLDSAVTSLRRALEINPDDAEALSNLGLALHDLGQFAAAAASCRRAIDINPDFAEAHNNLGLALHALGQYEDAASSCRRAIELLPDFAEAHNNLGNALSDSGQMHAAMQCYRRAIKIKPDFAEAHNNLGGTLKDTGQFDASIASYRRAVELRPDYFEAHSNLLFTLSYTASTTTEVYKAEAMRFGANVTRKVASKFNSWQCDAQPQRLRIGLVSGDLRNHPVGYFTESLLAELVSHRVELFAYSSNPKQDDLTARIRPYFAQWREVFSPNDEQIARLIHHDGIHILIDLAGHTAKNCLPALVWKPAPIQVSWLGYFASTGVAEIDYLLADAHIAPEVDESHFTEAIWHIPNSYLCFTAPDIDIPTAALPALASGQITFGCFNNLTKMNEAVIALWTRVLLAVSGSRLFLKTKQLNDATVCATVCSQFAAHGISADRLILEGDSPRAELLVAYQRVDIALDPFPYPGGTTSIEALWMGVPVLTKCGDRFLSRMGESILHNAGLPDWIAANEDDYVAKAVAHTTNLDRLSTLHSGLRQQVMSSPLFDAKRFAENFEQALWGMWQNWQQQRGNT